MKKTKSRWESTNFLTNAVTLVFIILGYQGIQMTIDPGQAVTEVLAANWEYIGSILFPALSGLAFKVIQKIKEKSWDWKTVVKSTNFWTQAITVLAGAMAFIGILLPATAPQALTDAIFSGSIWTLILAIAANVLTPIWQFIKPLIIKPKDVPAPVKPR